MNAIEIKNFGVIYPHQGANQRIPYEHQSKAMKNLDIINQKPSYSTLIVLPTGGGKTATASTWLLKNAIDKGKKVLWIAHRTLLLTQAAESFMGNAYHEVIPNISSFTYRIISGSHDRAIHIEHGDKLLIASKDSLGRNPQYLDKWLDGENEIFLVIDEAHHSVAKTYRKIIDHIQNKVPKLKVIGLTATPFRTAEQEKGLLGKIFKDGVTNGIVDTSGITYDIGLKDLINKQILSRPYFETNNTEISYGDALGKNDWDNIEHLDILPKDIEDDMTTNAVRNKVIVDKYKDNQEKYGQTIVFAINVNHAIQLRKQFEMAGIKAAYVVSDIRNMDTGVTISRKDNEKNIEDFREKKIQVLINVNILTEGTDLPQTQTVFLTRPTVSTTLMTQMVGRALRGEKAGGTKNAYVVSFLDTWKAHIAWANPNSLFGDHDFVDKPATHKEHILRLIAISKIEEFAMMLDRSVDTQELQKIERAPFITRIPIGMYAFQFQEQGNEDEEGMDISYQVMIYDSTKEAYESLMGVLPDLFENFGVNDKEYLDDTVLNDMEEQCRETYFCGDMIPPYVKNDVISILKYYAQKSVVPQFYPFEDIDRNELDVSNIAKHIVDEDMGPSKQSAYVNELWDKGDDNLLRVFFGRINYFMDQIENEIHKLTMPQLFEEDNNVKYGTRKLEDLSLHEIGEHDPEYEKTLRDGAFEKARTADGQYQCAICGIKGEKVLFQVDHIVPLNKGGKSEPENLQILCRQCNGKKGDQ